MFDVSGFLVIWSSQMACIVLFWQRKPDENCYIVNLLLILNIFLHCLDNTSCHAVFLYSPVQLSQQLLPKTKVICLSVWMNVSCLWLGNEWFSERKYILQQMKLVYVFPRRWFTHVLPMSLNNLCSWIHHLLKCRWF